MKGLSRIGVDFGLVLRTRRASTGRASSVSAAILVLLAIALGACAARSIAAASPCELEAPLCEPPTGAYYRDGRLVLQYDAPKDPSFLVAAWSAEDLSPDEHNFRMAVLEPVAKPPATPAAMQNEWQRVTLLGHERWDAVVAALLERLAPDSPGTATVVTVQDGDFALFRLPGGQLRIEPLESRPANLPVGRRVSEEEFSAEANDYLNAELSRDAGVAGPVLFAAGEDELGGTFVLFDFARRQSVFIAHSPSEALPVQGLDFSLRLVDAVAIRSHVVSLLKNPVTVTNRLFWLTTHTGLTIMPHPVPGRGTIPPVTQAQSMDLDAWENRLDELVGTDRYAARMRPLIDGAAFFGALVQAIQGARESIDVRLYIFDRDDYALRIADLLKERSRSVSVRVLVDRIGTLTAGIVPRGSPYYSRTRDDSLVSVVDYLREDSKVKVRVVNNPWLTSDHTKVIVIDRSKAFVGGMNIGREYRYEWHDLMVEVEGPIVGRLRKDFDKRWAHTGFGGDLAFAIAAMMPETWRGASDEPDFVEVRPLYTRTGDAEILRAQLAAIRNAKSRIYVQQPYVSDHGIIAALIRARRRGVDVRFILPTRSDSGFMSSANLITANAFIDNGIRLYVYPGMTHVKAAIYDGWAVVGSANFDKLSLRINQETNLATSDPRFVEVLECELFEVDFARSTEWTEKRRITWRDYVSRFIAKQM